MIDESTEFGARVAHRLREESVVWLTTVTGAGAPLPRPVWFVWDGGESVLVYSMPGARVRNLQERPRVTLNFDGNGQGGDIVVLSGSAAVLPDAPPASAPGPYRDKYESAMGRVAGSPEAFAERYGVPVRIALTKLDGH